MSPTTGVYCKGTNIPYATVGRYLQYMREHGMIDYKGHRCYRTKKQLAFNTHTMQVPLLGHVACGVPKYAEENIEGYVSLPVSLLVKDHFICYEPMENPWRAGINTGDLVLIRKQDTHEPGQIVVALIEEEATMKRYYPEPEKQRIRLQPENDSLDDIIVSHCEIQGVAVKVIKDLQ
ncbi:MAG: repressor LexA [bacterium LCO1.1]|uniref:Repressor LexA n=1 Tax=Candidatus Weimeria bifida TaxID=2599074 RepID=A0A6N7J0L4_9FIRM|nr:repressor LexA [Candidatus Weimeria bifida]